MGQAFAYFVCCTAASFHTSPLLLLLFLIVVHHLIYNSTHGRNPPASTLPTQALAQAPPLSPSIPTPYVSLKLPFRTSTPNTHHHSNLPSLASTNNTNPSNMSATTANNPTTAPYVFSGTYPIELILQLPRLVYTPPTQWEMWMDNLQIALDLAREFGWTTCFVVKEIMKMVATAGLKAISYIMDQPIVEKYRDIIQIIRAVAGAMYNVAGTGISAVQAGVSMTLTGLYIVSGAAETMLLNCMSKPIIWGADFVCNTAWAAKSLYYIWFRGGGRKRGGEREEEECEE